MPRPRNRDIYDFPSDDESEEFDWEQGAAPGSPRSRGSQRPSGSHDRILQVQLPELSAAARLEYRRVQDQESSGEVDVDPVADGKDPDINDATEAGDNVSGQDSEPESAPRRGRTKGSKMPTRRRRQAVAKGLSNSLDRFVKDLPHTVQKTQQWMAENRPGLSGLAEVQTMLPRLPIDEEWTVRDQRLVEKRWRNNPRRGRMLDVRGNKDNLTMYKSCLRLMRCFPEDIISCLHDLEYDCSQNRVLANGHRSLIWSASFCRSLTALLVHPLWGGCVHLLVMAIQYTVVVDTNKHGHWTGVTPPAWEGFLRHLARLKKKHPDRKVSDIRKELRDSTWGLDEDPESVGRSPWDSLFETLEVLAEERHRNESEGGPASQWEYDGALLVHRRHLGQLERALNSTSHMGFPIFMSLELYNRGINGRRAVKDYPQERHLAALRDYAILREHERLYFFDRLETEANDFDGDDGQVGDDVEVPETQSREDPHTGHAGPSQGGNGAVPDDISEPPRSVVGRKRSRSSDPRSAEDTSAHPPKRRRLSIIEGTPSPGPRRAHHSPSLPDYSDLASSPVLPRLPSESPGHGDRVSDGFGTGETPGDPISGDGGELADPRLGKSPLPDVSGLDGC
ncbi:hypothetical protein C8A00DRAFT_38977 [Chaetomidium leptoderma]|uniref:Uncharacterized protein n=1 Tax=Chaetomidium leptoderma TaxID=669021 RepID=A0AAN6VBL7_9PEZI|nr:hypothetical protein C8A00DRAFT_38977 [Chaetomidium leptoderma]